MRGCRSSAPPTMSASADPSPFDFVASHSSIFAVNVLLPILATVIVLGVVFLVLCAINIVVIKNKTAMVVERLGRYRRTVRPPSSAISL